MKRFKDIIVWISKWVIPWVLPIPVFVLLFYLASERLDSNLVVAIISILLFLLLYNQFFSNLTIKFIKKTGLGDYLKLLRVSFSLELILFIAFLIIYSQITMETFGSFTSYLDYILIPTVMFMVFSLLSMVILFLLGWFLGENVPSSINSHLYLNIVILFLFVVFWERILESDNNYYVVLHSQLIAVSMVYIGRLFTDIQNIVIEEENKFIFVVVIVGVFISNIVTMNMLLYRFQPDSFGFASEQIQDSFTIFYYSIINITSVGFGDVYPISVSAKFVSLISSLFGYFLLFTLVSVFISKKMVSKESS